MTSHVLPTLLAAVCAAAFAARGEDLPAADGAYKSPLKVTADRMAADNLSGTLVASGHVRAVSAPLCLLSELVEKRGDTYRFSDPTGVTTCTNGLDRLHWLGSGEIVYRDGRHLVAKNLTLRAWGVPVLWLPYWYYPLDTDYGWRVMPGYTSRWGAYLLTKYVYGIAGGFGPGEWGLYGSTRVDLRTENGVAFGQGLGWQLGDAGRGRFKAYYAWDEDSGRYDRSWTRRRKWHYENWGSEVPHERYGLMLEHRWDATERDAVRIKGAYYSDSHFRDDFLRGGHFGQANRFLGHDGNELAWEHTESGVGLGVSVSGPMNEFYGGVARLPEAYLDVAPRPLPWLPVNYESASRAGFLNRNYALRGRAATSAPFRYDPGEWADYQAFRFDTYHRLTLPFRIADAVSVVPRVGARGTFWSDAGRGNLTGSGRAGTTGDGVWRSIVEGGATFSARGTASLDGGWRHVLEPYLDVLAQEAEFHGLGRGERPYVFDSLDASCDWLDQFAGRSRNLPYSWYGVTPGVRNAFRRADDAGRLRTVFDLDLYASVQFNDTAWTEGSRHHRLARDPADPNYGRHAGALVPGVRARLFPSEDAALWSRAEFDVENGAVAYAAVEWRQRVSRDFSWNLSFFGRDQRRWDFASTPYVAGETRDEGFNRAKFGYLELGCEQELCDAVAWGPFVRWDCREGGLDEIGGWLDLRTDCLGFRFSIAYEDDCRRVDGSEDDEDWRFGFFVYLRALGPGNGSPF